MTETLLLALYIGLGSAAINILVRSAPFVDRWMLAGKKPWVCDVCMTLWTSLGIVIALSSFYSINAPLAWLPGYAIGKWVLSRLSEPHSAPPAPGGHHMDPLPADIDEEPTRVVTADSEDNTFFDTEKGGTP